MAALDIFITFFLFLFLFLFFFLPHLTAATCPRSTCTSDGPPIRFPFRLANKQFSDCGYPGFDLSCTNQKQTILTLPSSGDFIVQDINYKEQTLTINDQENCLPKLFLHGDYFNLTDSPFTFLTPDIRNYTFLNCSAQDGTWWAGSISCLSNDYYKVLLVPTSDPATSWSPCSIISTAMVPMYSSFQWIDLDDALGIHLSWDKPDCRSCEAGGLRCEFQNATNPQVQCSGSSHTSLSRSAKYGILLGVGIPGILCTLGFGLGVCDRVGRARDGLHRRQSMTELTTAVDQQVQPSRVIVGLDGPTIESYPKIQLDVSLELPEPDDKTCSICLCEYQPKETIRIIPDCSHYFHASCIYEWFRKNPTCPLCRNPPEGWLKI